MAPAVPDVSAVKKMKVVELKASLNSFGLPTDGLKAVLQARLLDFVNNQPKDDPMDMNDDVKPNPDDVKPQPVEEDVKPAANTPANTGDVKMEEVDDIAARPTPVTKKEEEQDVKPVAPPPPAVKRERPPSPPSTTTTATTASTKKKPKPGFAAPLQQSCPYLDTISRPSLDFDQSQSCSLTLTRSSVYMCLICGQCFSGRGPGTPAHTHSVEQDHAVFVSLTGPSGTPSLPPRYYCLPENYEIKNEPSLYDITEACRPTSFPLAGSALDKNVELSKDALGHKYLRGYVGMNNLSKTDAMSNCALSLCHVPSLRDYFLSCSELSLPNAVAGVNVRTGEAGCVALRFGEVVRKVWSGGRFRSGVDPQEFVQEVVARGGGRFKVGTRAVASDFMSWLVNELHRGLLSLMDKKGRKTKRTAITDAFQGEISVRNITTRKKEKEEKGMDDSVVGGKGGARADDDGLEVEESIADVNFLHLTLEVPHKPLFKEEDKVRASEVTKRRADLPFLTPSMLLSLRQPFARR